MPRFGKMAVFHKDIRESGPLARLFVKIMGSPSFTAHNFYLHMKKMLPERSYNTILDAGCGKGDFTFYMAEKYPDSRVEGWDKSDEDLHELGENIAVCEDIKAKSGVSNAFFFKRDLLELETNEHYDLIVCIHVLEHIRENREVLQRFYAALQPGGYLHVQMPNNIKYNFFLLRKYTNFSEWSEHEHVGERYDVGAFSSLLCDIGFEVVNARTDGHCLSGAFFDITETLRRRESRLLYGLVLPIIKAANLLLSNFDNNKGSLVVLAVKPNSK